VLSQGAGGYIDGTSSNGGVSFTWSQTSGLGIPKALVADPSSNLGTKEDLFLLVQNTQTGMPFIALSIDGGRTFTLGSTLINPTDIPASLWQGPNGTLAIGNLVARRTPAGLRLYSVIETGAGIALHSRQGAPQFPTLSRVFEAMGTVSALTPSHPLPSVTWHDAAVYAGSFTATLDPHGAATTVDSVGRVYATFTDGRHLYVKADRTGLGWNAVTAPAIIDSAPGMPPGSAAVSAPAVAAGADGMVDVAWYEATAPGSWHVLMAQSINRGRAWHVYPVSGSVHAGSAAGSLQLVVNEATGAAAIAYSGDLASPGLPSLFATRQCGGLSITTGRALVDNCAAPRLAQSVIPGSVCSGPQVRNRAFNALHNGANIAALDVYTARFSTVTSTTQAVTITVGAISPALPHGVTKSFWRVTWMQGPAHRYYAEAMMGAGRPATYSVGVMRADGTTGPGTAVSGHMGEVADGSNTGAITIEIPLTAIGNPTGGTPLSNIVATSLAVFTGSIPVAQVVDRAPDGSAGAAFSVQQACPPASVVPEVPAAALLPLVGGVAGIIVMLVRRRRSRSVTHG
jgi:hypothetical protein